MENKSNFWFVVVILFLALLMVSAYVVYTRMPIAGPNAPTPPIVEVPTPVPPVVYPAITEPTRVELKLYEKRQLGELSITPWAVLEDSRCPRDVQCIQAGRVTVAFNLSGPSGNSALQLEVGKTGSTENLQLTLDEVRPATLSTHKITDAEYRFIVTLAPKFPAGAVACYIGGCSGQLCTDEPNAVSTCEYSERYACYQSATWKRQENGECGWTATLALEQCLNTAR